MRDGFAVRKFQALLGLVFAMAVAWTPRAEAGTGDASSYAVDETLKGKFIVCNDSDAASSYINGLGQVGPDLITSYADFRRNAKLFHDLNCNVYLSTVMEFRVHREEPALAGKGWVEVQHTSAIEKMMARQGHGEYRTHTCTHNVEKHCAWMLTDVVFVLGECLSGCSQDWIYVPVPASEAVIDASVYNIDAKPAPPPPVAMKPQAPPPVVPAPGPAAPVAAATPREPAELKVCNKSSESLYAAFGRIAYGQRETSGWRKMAPDECRTAWTGGLVKGITYLFYAEPVEGGGSWRGDDRDDTVMGCVRSPEAFNFDASPASGCGEAPQAPFEAVCAVQSSGGFTYNFTDASTPESERGEGGSFATDSEGRISWHKGACKDDPTAQAARWSPRYGAFAKHPETGATATVWNRSTLEEARSDAFLECDGICEVRMDFGGTLATRCFAMAKNGDGDMAWGKHPTIYKASQSVLNTCNSKYGGCWVETSACSD